MTQKEFNTLSKALDYMAKDVMKSKGPEYTQQDRDVLANFKNTAERLNTVPLKVWGAFFDDLFIPCLFCLGAGLFPGGGSRRFFL